MNEGNIGFDALYSKPFINFKGIGVNSGGSRAIVSSPSGGTYHEYLDDDSDGILLLPEAADSVGFFGSTLDLVAIATGEILRIFHMSQFKIIKTYLIRPGSLYVSPSGRASRIGIVTPKGKCKIITDRMEVIDSGLKSVPENYEVIWGQNTRPIGYMWVESGEEDSSVNIFVNSRVKGIPPVQFSSDEAISVFTAWESAPLERNEVYLTQNSTSNILHRFTSDEEGQPKLEIAAEFNGDVTVSNVITSSSGMPILVSGTDRTTVSTIPIPPENDVAYLISDILSKEDKMTMVKCMGSVSSIMWSETPVTPPIASIMNHGIKERPTKELKSYKSNFDAFRPVHNSTRGFVTTDGGDVRYRLISPSDPREVTADNIVIIPDFTGYVSSGHYSPTVKMLYSMGITVAVLSVNRSDGKGGMMDNKTIINDLPLDITDTAHDLYSSKIGNEFTVLADASSAVAAVESLSTKNSPIRNVILFNPEETSYKMKSKKWNRVAVMHTDDNIPSWIGENAVKVDISEDIHKEVDLIEAVSEFI